MPSFYRLCVTLPEPLARSLADVLEAEETESYTLFESADGWRVEVPQPRLPGEDEIEALRERVRRLGIAEASIEVETVADRDWLTENRRQWAPVRIGRFVIHGRMDRQKVGAGALGIELEAGQAFGTGRHASTRLCLSAIETIVKRRRIRRALDLGCGSGVLAIAVARAARARVLATDIDPIAVRVALANVRANGVAARVHVIPSAGCRAIEGRFDLILANILARPLEAMAGDLAARLAPGGEIVLAGILDAQARALVARYRAEGLVLRRHFTEGGWAALLFGRSGPIGRQDETPALV